MHWTSAAFRRAFATSPATADYPTIAPTLTEPTGDGVHVLARGPGLPVPGCVQIVPFGTDADGEAFNLKVVGWRRTQGLDARPVWVPVTLLEITCTLSTPVGVAGGDVAATDFFADTIAVVQEAVTNADTTDDGTTLVWSPANDTIAMAECDVRGFEKVQFAVDLNTAASGNALVCFN